MAKSLFINKIEPPDVGVSHMIAPHVKNITLTRLTRRGVSANHSLLGLFA